MTLESTREKKPKLHKVVGIRNTITDGVNWKYLLFYDLDNVSDSQIKALEIVCNTLPTSYIMYSTQKGLHIVGLTPLDIESHAFCFAKLQREFPTYYSGGTIRMSRRKGENQELIAFNISKGVTLNLY